MERAEGAPTLVDDDPVVGGDVPEGELGADRIGVQFAAVNEQGFERALDRSVAVGCRKGFRF